MSSPWRGALGLLIAYGALDLLVSFVARFTPRAVDVAIDSWVLGFTLVVALGTAVAFGVLPALGSKVNLVSPLREGGQSTTGKDRQRIRSGLTIVQVAISAMLLVVAGLMLRSLYNLQQVDPGFDPEKVLASRVTLNWTNYTTPEQARDFFERVLDNLEGHPGVVSAAVGTYTPLSQQGPSNASFVIEGQPLEEGQLAPQLDFRVASPGFFRTLGIPLVRGRIFTEADHADSLPVAVVNQSLSTRYWPDRDPIGRRISLDNGQTWVHHRRCGG